MITDKAMLLGFTLMIGSAGPGPALASAAGQDGSSVATSVIDRPLVTLSAYVTIESRNAVCGSALGGHSLKAAMRIARGCITPDLGQVALSERGSGTTSSNSLAAIHPPSDTGTATLLVGLARVSTLAAAGNQNERRPLSPE